MKKLLFFNPRAESKIFSDFFSHLSAKKNAFGIVCFSPSPKSENTGPRYLALPVFFLPKNTFWFFLNPLNFLYYLRKFIALKKEYTDIVFLKQSDFLALMLPALVFNRICLFAGAEQYKPLPLPYRIITRLFKNKFIYLPIGADSGLTDNGGIKTSPISPGITAKGLFRQENIFDNLALRNSPESKKGFFTLGTIADFGQEHNLEKLFHAVIELKKHIPNLQITIIGGGEERKKLIWQCQKLKIDAFTWFVGEQKYLGKWLASFNLYLNLNAKNHLENIAYALCSMAYGLPVIALEDSGLDPYVKNLENGLLLPNLNSEALIDAVLKLQRNRTLRQNISRSNKALVDNSLNLDTMVNQFLKAVD